MMLAACSYLMPMCLAAGSTSIYHCGSIIGAMAEGYNLVVMDTEANCLE